MKRISGIYAIHNLNTGRKYIGQSINIKNRWRKHLFELRRNIHHSPYLQNSFNKHGESAFIFGIIEECPKENLSSREQYWIDTMDTYHNGYNTTETTDNGGRMFSKEEKDRYASMGRTRWETYTGVKKKKVIDRLNSVRHLVNYVTKSISIYDNKTYELIKTFDNYQECADYIGADIDRLYKKVIEIKKLEKRSYKGYVLIGESFSIEEYIENKEELDRVRFIKLQEQKEFNRVKRELNKKPLLPKEELDKILAENAKKGIQAIRDRRDKVLQVYKDGIVVTTVLTPADVERVLGMKSVYVQKVLRGEKKSYKGHAFAYIPRTEEYSYIV